MTKPLTALINSSLDSGTNGKRVTHLQRELDALRYLILNHGEEDAKDLFKAWMYGGWPAVVRAGGSCPESVS